MMERQNRDDSTLRTPVVVVVVLSVQSALMLMLLMLLLASTGFQASINNCIQHDWSIRSTVNRHVLRGFDKSQSSALECIKISQL